MEKQKEEKKEKLSYEKLEAYAAQMQDQANRLYRQNIEFKKQLESNVRALGLKELECALKCVELKDSFSGEFINKVIKRIEEILDPEAKEETKDEQLKSE